MWMIFGAPASVVSGSCGSTVDLVGSNAGLFERSARRGFITVGRHVFLRLESEGGCWTSYAR